MPPCRNVVALGVVRGDVLLPLRRPGDGAAVDEVGLPRYGVPILSRAAFRVCSALWWAAFLAVHES